MEAYPASFSGCRRGAATCSSPGIYGFFSRLRPAIELLYSFPGR